MSSDRPIVVVIGGPNGAGKSTIAPHVLRSAFPGLAFVNADTIARGLSQLEPERQAFAAGRVMLAHIHRLTRNRRSFAFESTLASRTFAPLLRQVRTSDYLVHLIYVCLRSPDLAVARVRARVESGGHSVPEETVRRRFRRSVSNLFDLYIPLADVWEVVDNSTSAPPHLVATGGRSQDTMIQDEATWQALEKYR